MDHEKGDFYSTDEYILIRNQAFHRYAEEYFCLELISLSHTLVSWEPMNSNKVFSTMAKSFYVWNSYI